MAVQLLQRHVWRGATWTTCCSAATCMFPSLANHTLRCTGPCQAADQGQSGQSSAYCEWSQHRCGSSRYHQTKVFWWVPQRQCCECNKQWWCCSNLYSLWVVELGRLYRELILMAAYALLAWCFVSICCVDCLLAPTRITTIEQALYCCWMSCGSSFCAAPKPHTLCELCNCHHHLQQPTTEFLDKTALLTLALLWQSLYSLSSWCYLSTSITAWQCWKIKFLTSGVHCRCRDGCGPHGKSSARQCIGTGRQHPGLGSTLTPSQAPGGWGQWEWEWWWGPTCLAGLVLPSWSDMTWHLISIWLAIILYMWVICLTYIEQNNRIISALLVCILSCTLDFHRILNHDIVIL